MHGRGHASALSVSCTGATRRTLSRSRVAVAFSAVLLVTFPANADIGVTGTRPDFFTQVRAALKLLKEKAPEEYKQIEKDIGMIKEVEAWHLSGMNPFADPPTFSLSITTVRISVTWCAGAIAHDACHSREWHAYARKHPKEAVPDSVWTGQAAELRCIAHEIEVMKRIGAPAWEIEDLRRTDGLHYLRTWRFR